jgi:4-diphosphocytidyl-2-C-methyl-D-erythritol kinase
MADPPPRATAAALVDWLRSTRNDLEPPARLLAPPIGETLAALAASGARLARMTGSGATCFGLYASAAAAAAGARRLARPGWWVAACTLR